MAHRCLLYNNSKVVWELPPQTGYDRAATLLREQPDVDRGRVIHGNVEALIVPNDAGERLLNQSNGDQAWNAWQVLVN